MKYGNAILIAVSLLFSGSWLPAEETVIPSPRLADTLPWDLKSLSKPPTFHWLNKQGPVRSLLYDGKPYKGKPTRVFAYYASPGTLSDDVSNDTNVPAIVLVHGGGGTAFSEWAEQWAKRGYAAIAMDLAGHRPIAGKNAHNGRNRIPLDNGGPNQSDDEKFGSVNKPLEDQWPYHAVANVVLAHSLIRGFKGVDRERTAVTGISWGGYLTCIVAGVDHRFKAAVPVYGCGFLHENSAWLGRFAKMNPKQRARWTRLWDPSRYLMAVSMPMLFVNGTNDFAYPLDSYMKSFEAVPGKKQLCVTVKMPHGHQAGWAPKEIGLFVDQHLNGTKPLPVLECAMVKDGQATVKWKRPSSVKLAEMHYTTDTTEINKREWTSTRAMIDGQQVKAPAPPDDVTAWFFTVEDERGATVSSRVMLTALANEPAKSRVNFNILDETSGSPTPAMICLRCKHDGTVRLPPDGRVLREVGKTQEFYDGIGYDAKDPGWIGPVRMMNGKGDNSDRSYVYDDLPSVPHWREPIAHQTKSQFSVQLEPGDYRISVSRGMEFIPIHKDFTVESGKSDEYTIRLKRWTNLAEQGWYSGDVHVHHPTRKKSHRDFLLSYAEAEDLNVVNVLEMGHHQGTDFKQLGFGKEFREIRGNYCLVSGQEEPRSTFGHIIGLNTTKLARDLSTYDFYDVAFHRIHAQKGALVGFAHFSWNGCNLPRGFPWYVSTEALDFIELLQFAKINRPDYYDYLNLGFRLTAAAGSDIPWGSTIGECRTYVFTGGKTLEIDAWFDGLRKGNTFVSNGPALFFTVDGQVPGSALKPKAGDRLKIHARAFGHESIGLPEKLEIISGEGVVKSVTRDATMKGDLTLDFEIKAESSGWITAHTSCKNGAIAHATPVYIVVDGRPTWSPTKGPALIKKQLNAIVQIEEEFYADQSLRANGVRERLARARAYYSKLLKAMQSSPPKAASSQ